MSTLRNERVIRVGLADDQRLLREGLRIILEAAPNIEVVGDAEDGVAAVELALREQPDVMLVDIRMPRQDGIAATQQIRQVAPQTRVILLTTYDMPDLVADGMRAGASGFLLKDSSAAELRAAILAVISGQLLLQGQSAAHLLAGLKTPESSLRLEKDFGLTDREHDVLAGIARGLDNSEIAAELVVSEATVKTHINHIFAKLGARSRAQALVLARRHGLV
jgi:DNA-binding NarL/FixJ family response regulator